MDSNVRCIKVVNETHLTKDTVQTTLYRLNSCLDDNSWEAVNLRFVTNTLRHI